MPGNRCTRKKIAEDAKKLRELLDKAEDVATKLGAQDALADFHLDAEATLLQALEGEPIPARFPASHPQSNAIVLGWI